MSPQIQVYAWENARFVEPLNDSCNISYEKKSTLYCGRLILNGAEKPVVYSSRKLEDVARVLAGVIKRCSIDVEEQGLNFNKVPEDNLRALSEQERRKFRGEFGHMFSF